MYMCIIRTGMTLFNFIKIKLYIIISLSLLDLVYV